MHKLLVTDEQISDVHVSIFSGSEYDDVMCGALRALWSERRRPEATYAVEHIWGKIMDNRLSGFAMSGSGM